MIDSVTEIRPKFMDAYTPLPFDPVKDKPDIDTKFISWLYKDPLNDEFSKVLQDSSIKNTVNIDKSFSIQNVDKYLYHKMYLNKLKLICNSIIKKQLYPQYGYIVVDFFIDKVAIYKHAIHKLKLFVCVQIPHSAYGKVFKCNIISKMDQSQPCVLKACNLELVGNVINEHI